MTMIRRVNQDDYLKKFENGIDAWQGGDTNRALDELQASADIAAQLQIPMAWANSILSVAELHRATGNDTKAEEIVLSAIERTSKLAGKDRTPYALCMGTLGVFYLGDGKIEEATQQLENACEILRRRRHLLMDYEHLLFFCALSLCYVELSEWSKADKLAKYTYDLCKKVAGPDDMLTVGMLFVRYASATALGNWGEANSLRHRCLSLLKQNIHLESTAFRMASELLRAS